MAKRFGRTRRRKMRQEMEQLQTRLTRVERAVNTNADIVRYTAEVLGRYFITLDPQNVVVKCIDDVSSTWRMAVVDTQSSWYDWRDSGSSISQQQFLEIALPVMRATAGAERTELQQLMKVKIYQGDQYLGYAWNPDVLNFLSKDDSVDMIAREMSELLCERLRG